MRDRILIVSAEMIGLYGYGGTTTRGIADALSIRQPSLFHHFKSKAEILDELFRHSLEPAVPRIKRFADGRGPAAPRLLAYLTEDLEDVLTSPFNQSGVYGEDVLHIPRFRRWAEELDLLVKEQCRLISQGVRSGEFVKIDPPLAQQLVAGVTLGLIRGRAGRVEKSPARDAEAAACFTVQGLLAKPAGIQRVRRAAEALAI